MTLHYTDRLSFPEVAKFSEREQQQTHSLELSMQPYSFEMVHRPGSANGNADALSRGPTDPCLSQEKGEGM